MTEQEMHHRIYYSHFNVRLGAFGVLKFWLDGGDGACHVIFWTETIAMAEAFVYYIIAYSLSVSQPWPRG